MLMSCVCLVGGGMSEVSMLKSVGERMPLCVSLSISLCMLIVLNVLLMSNTTDMVRSGGSFWLNLVAIVLLMQCSKVSVECLLLYPCCVVMCGMLSVMKGKNVLSSVLASVDIRKNGLY